MGIALASLPPCPEPRAEGTGGRTRAAGRLQAAEEGLASKTLIAPTQALLTQGQHGNSKELQMQSSSICSSWQDFCLDAGCLSQHSPLWRL